MVKVARGFLYCFGVFILSGGIAAFGLPHLITEIFHLAPVTILGTAEIRCLYGGGFFSFGVITLIGLRSGSLGPGLLMAMAIFMWSVAAARAISIPIDHEVAFTVPALVAEIILGLAYWTASRGKNRHEMRACMPL